MAGQTSMKAALKRHQSKLAQCRQCPDMLGNPVYGYPNVSEVVLIGQAPGIKEIEVNKPFAWTAGKTLFKWLSSIGLEESAVRQRIYMTAVCRCFPGKNPKGGDRVPNSEEIQACSQWLQREIQLLKPKLLIPVGKLAISQFIPVAKLDQIIGSSQQVELATLGEPEQRGLTKQRGLSTHSGSAKQSAASKRRSGLQSNCDLIALPHPSGASTWHRSEPGKQLLQQALQLVQSHPAWQALLG